MTDQPNLKPRELEILNLLAEGLTNVEIGARLFLSHETVRWYNKHLFNKLTVKNRTEAVKRGNELGLIGSTNNNPLPKMSPVHYAVNGNVHIAYQIIGKGPVDILFLHGFISHLELAWENPEFRDFFEQLGRFARVILFDKRGVGLSDRIQGAPTLDETVNDANHVLDAVASKRTFVMGTSEGAAAAVLLASTYPDRVSGLILYGATPKIIRSGNQPEWAEIESDYDEMIEHMQRSWGEPWAVEVFAPSRANDENFRKWWAKVLRSASSPSSIEDVFNLIRKVDIRQLLPQIQARTLVIHKTDDRMVSREAGKYFADHMPNARWNEIPGDDHIYFVNSEAIISAVSKFIQESPIVKSTETRISVILCVHISNEKTSSPVIQKEVNLHGARFTAKDGSEFTATFDSPTKAVECATRLLGAKKGNDLKISLHVGECYAEDGKPLEYVAEISRKAIEYASVGEILITQTLYDILAGSKLKLQQHSDKADMLLPDDMVLYTLT
jgi:pimeloyl-ACP methyl ester carboxylesterase/DNA-binding CsgD family transcriptional regulator